MKYEFHVGDYVETITNEIGYIIAIENLLIGLSIRVQLPTRIQEFIVTEVTIPTCFNRIGQYDFAKPKQPRKIKGLKSYGWNVSIGGDDLINKINELVEAVNRLEDKVDDN